MTAAIVPDENTVSAEIWSLIFEYPDQVEKKSAEGHAVIDPCKVGCIERPIGAYTEE